MRYLGLALALFFGTIALTKLASGANVLCVMKMNVGNSNPCHSNIPQFAEVAERDNPGQFICTRSYADNFCKHNKNEFYHALGRNGASVCVMNFKQQLIGNPCSAEGNYAYTVEPW